MTGAMYSLPQEIANHQPLQIITQQCTLPETQKIADHLAMYPPQATAKKLQIISSAIADHHLAMYPPPPRDSKSPCLWVIYNKSYATIKIEQKV